VRLIKDWVGACALAARPGADRVQGRRTDVQSSSRNCAPRYLGPLVRVVDLPGGRRTLRSAGTNRLLVSTVRLSSVCDQPLGFQGRWTPCLEHSAGGHNNISVIARLHDEAGSTSWLYEPSSSFVTVCNITPFKWPDSQLIKPTRRALDEPASSCKRGITLNLLPTPQNLALQKVYPDIIIQTQCWKTRFFEKSSTRSFLLFFGSNLGFVKGPTWRVLGFLWYIRMSTAR